MSKRSKKRLDVLLVERGLAESRSQAQALVLAGRVKGFDKAGEQVDETATLEVDAGPRFVSRGGEKLAHALDAFEIDVTGADCLDVGASTGGFTDCLLQAGAARVCALDVGHGQLHPRLRRRSARDRARACQRPSPRLRGPAVSARRSSPATSRSSAWPRRSRPPWRAPRPAGGRSCWSSPSSRPAPTRSEREASCAIPTSSTGSSTRSRRVRPNGEPGSRARTESPLRGPKGNREFFLYLTGEG